MGNNGYKVIQGRVAGAAQSKLQAMLLKLTGGEVDPDAIAAIADGHGVAFVTTLKDMRGESTEDGGVSKNEKEG